MINVAILASGGGSNAKKIIEHFQNNTAIKISCVITNKKHAGVVQIAKDFDIPYYILKSPFERIDEQIINILESHQVKYIVLAGFLLLLPPVIIQKFANRILNIHPSLLPKFGGKGMYGHHVHKNVVAAGERFTGMTIHLVNEIFDSGKILFQASCKIIDNSPDAIASQVLKLEHQYYSEVIEDYINQQEH